MKYTLLCFLNAISLVGGQMLFKLGMKDKTIDSVPAIIRALFTPLVLLGLVLYALTTMLWLYILNKVPISRAYPIQALAFPLVAIISFLFLKETIPIYRWIGIGIIFAGVIIVAQ